MSLNTYPYNPFPASTDKLDEAHNADLQAEVDQLKEDTEDLQKDVKTLETDKTDTAVIAQTFDAEAGVYAAGDLVMYQGKLYEFTTAHEMAGDWDSTEVTEKTVADEVDTVKSGLTNLDDNFTDVIGWDERKNLSVSQQNNTDLAHLSAGTYTISYKGNFKMNLDVKYDDESSWTRIVENVYAPQAFVLSKAGTVNLNAFSNDIYDIQIEKGSTATQYEPYHPVIGPAVEDLLNKVPDAPSTDGTYSLQVTVADGVPSYSWVSGS